MKILVTGSNGLLGQKLVYALKEKKGVELLASSKGVNRMLDQEGYQYFSLDVTDEAEVKNILEKYQPDTVIHTAAMTNVDVCESEKENCWKLNVNAVQNIVASLEILSSDNYRPHLIHLSTDFIFDGLQGPYKEEDSPAPVSYYGLSKLEAEKIVLSSSIKSAILRTVLVYGVVDSMSRSNIVLWAKGALEKGQPINVVDDQFRTPTLAEDLAQACILAAEKKATGVFHISGADFMSIIELVERVADFYGLDKKLIRPVKSDTLNQPAKRPPVTGFVLDKARKELNYQPHSFIEGLKIVNSQLNK